MSLPPLPAAAYVYKKHHDPVYDDIYFTEDQIKAYGQQCREAALEQAALSLLNAGFKSNGIPAYESLAERVRKLK